jgi:drug/metabolite transporter (DMT)-like permease
VVHARLTFTTRLDIILNFLLSGYMIVAKNLLLFNCLSNDLSYTTARDSNLVKNTSILLILGIVVCIAVAKQRS